MRLRCAIPVDRRRRPDPLRPSGVTFLSWSDCGTESWELAIFLASGGDLCCELGRVLVCGSGAGTIGSTPGGRNGSAACKGRMPSQWLRLGIDRLCTRHFAELQ